MMRVLGAVNGSSKIKSLDVCLLEDKYDAFECFEDTEGKFQ